MTNAVRFGLSAPYPFRESWFQSLREQSGIRIEVGPSRAMEGPPRRVDHSFDLLLLDEVETVEMIRDGALAMLGRRAHADGVDLDDFPQAAIDRFRASDVVYAIPLSIRSHVLIYRTDILERLDLAIPSTWDELREAANRARNLLAAAGIDDIAGFAGPGLAGIRENFVLLGHALFPSWGWRWNQGPGQPPAVYEPATVAATEFYAALLREAGPPDAAHISRDAARELFASGHAVFTIGTPTEFAAIPRTREHPFAMAMVPTGPSGRPEPGMLALSLCIPATSSVVDEAWAVLRHFISFEEMLETAVSESQPESARASVIESESYALAYGERFRHVLRHTRRYARMNQPLIPGSSELGEIVGAAVEATIAGDGTAEQALAVAQAKIDEMPWRR